MSQNSQKNTSDRVYPARYKMGTFAIILKNISDEPSLDFKEIRVETDSWTPTLSPLTTNDFWTSKQWLKNYIKRKSLSAINVTDNYF